MKIKQVLLLTFLLFTANGLLKAQDFVYQPLNPAFGGNYLNYSWLLSSANAQNTIKEPSSGSSGYGGYDYDPLADFQEDLERRFFSELSRQITDSYFGEGSSDNPIEDGSYSFGDYDISISSDANGVNITIIDYIQGGETTITIPYY